MQIDFHTHLLPNLDDGSRSVEESREMLAALQTQGVGRIVATPHFYSHKARLDDFLQKRKAAYDQLLAVCPDAAQKLLLGAEVSFFRGMGKADRIEELCISGTKAMLIEMPFAQWGHSEVAELHLILNRGITPIIAHIERYFSFQKDLEALNEIINLPVLLQINAQALQQWRTRRFVFKLMDHGFPVLLGTDCHNMQKRRPDMDAGRKILAQKYGQSCLTQMDALGAKLLNMEKEKA